MATVRWFSRAVEACEGFLAPSFMSESILGSSMIDTADGHGGTGRMIWSWGEKRSQQQPALKAA